MKVSARRKKLADELATLAKSGRLSPKKVVAWAKAHSGSALHGYFQWDDSRAAHQYRLWQARELIVSVEAVYDDGVKGQVYVSPTTTRHQGRGYHRLVDVMSDAALRAQFLTQALHELERICEKYSDLCELAGVRQAVRLVRQKAA